MTPSITDVQIFTALGDFLTSIVPAGVEVIRGQDNRVPMPRGEGVGLRVTQPNFVTMTATSYTRLETNVESWEVTPGTNPSAIILTTPTDVAIQLDVYGPLSGDIAQTIRTVLRSAYAVDTMPPSVQPLYCDDPRQMPLIDGEAQYESRWMMNAHLQANPAVSTPAQFANTVTVNIVAPADSGPVA